MKPHHKLLIALVAGAFLGILFNSSMPDSAFLAGLSKNILAPLGQVFLRLIFMIVVPMVFSALVLGVYELGQGQGLGRIASKTLLYTVIASSASVLIGVGLVNFFKPGVGFQLDATTMSAHSTAVEKIQSNAGNAKSFVDAIVEIIPKNPLESAVKALDGEMMSLMFFALFFGFAMSAVQRARGVYDDSVLFKFLQETFDISMKIVTYAMRLAPYAVFAIIFNTAYKYGYKIFISVAFYAGIVVLGLLVQQFVVYSAMLKQIAKKSPWQFFKKCRDVYLYAFSTASSNATLPLSISTAENELKLPPKVSRFVLTVGSTANQNGTALFEGITVLFLAQVYAVDLSVMQQFQVVLMSILAGIGTAGVPGGSLPLIMILLTQMGIPAEGMGLILGVDRFLDMCRTTLNVSGDLVIAAVVSKGEKA